MNVSERVRISSSGLKIRGIIIPKIDYDSVDLYDLKEFWVWIPNFKYIYMISNRGRVVQLFDTNDKPHIFTQIKGKHNIVQLKKGETTICKQRNQIMVDVFADETPIRFQKVYKEIENGGFTDIIPILNERWKPIKEFTNKYFISNLGRVKNLNFKRTGIEKLISLKNHQGRYYVPLSKDGKQCLFRLDRLVLEHFGRNYKNHNKIMPIGYRDGDRNNCKIKNLFYITQK